MPSKGYPVNRTDQWAEEIRALAESGRDCDQIAVIFGIGRGEVLSCAQRNGFKVADHRPRGRYVPPVVQSPRAELVAAARPWVQRPWSAKDGPSW